MDKKLPSPINPYSQDHINSFASLNCNDDAEDIDEAFTCCVCLDLLYKPIVLACGHISCFWCVHRAMMAVGESHCPICRCPYSHFPGICQLLHFLLLKMYPVAYMRRENEILEEEKKLCIFSPELGNDPSIVHTCKELNVPDSSCSPFAMCSPVEEASQCGDTCSNRKIYPSSTDDHQSLNQCLNENTSTISEETYSSLETTRTSDVKKNNMKHGTCELVSTNDTSTHSGDACSSFETKRTSVVEENNMKHGTCDLLSVNDVLCVACKQLLFQPAVLNCGHVYCQSCVATLADEALRCQLCRSLHPKGFLNVCLELDHLLEEKFPEEYALRGEAVKLQPDHGQRGPGKDRKQQSQSSSPRNWSYLTSLGDRGLNVHIGVGCDYCGMYPIVGERYKCKDCKENIGFDLCGECYNTRSKLPGRFNQQHTQEHKFEIVKSNLIRCIMQRLVSEHSEDSSIPVLSDDASEDPEDGLPSYVFSDDAPEDQDVDTNPTM